MKRRNALVLAGVSAAIVVVLAAACSFPDVEFGPGGSTGEGGSGNEGAAGEAASGDDGSTSDSSKDGGSDSLLALEGAPPIDATSEKPNIGSCTTACDCDKDLALAVDAMAGCTGKDCDDQDPRAHPGQSFLTDLATADTKGDWNCDGTTERLHPVLAANPCSGLYSAACDAIKGFTSDIPCGEFGEQITCGKGGTASAFCVQVDSKTVQQECR